MQVLVLLSATLFVFEKKFTLRENNLFINGNCFNYQNNVIHLTSNENLAHQTLPSSYSRHIKSFEIYTTVCDSLGRQPWLAMYGWHSITSSGHELLSEAGTFGTTVWVIFVMLAFNYIILGKVCLELQLLMEYFVLKGYSYMA